TFTFYLKEGVQWSDGVKMTARDFIYSWKRLLTQKTAASYAYLLFDIVGAKDFYDGKITDFSKVGVKALNDLTLEVKLSEPIAHWLQMTAFWVTFPLREDLVEKYGNDWVKPGKMQTLGPFVLSEYELDSKIILKKNPKYTRARGEIDEAVGLIVRDDSTAITLFETGRLDFMADLPTLDLKRFRGRPEFKVFPYLKIVFVGFSQKHSEVSSAALRRAFAMSIDKSKIPELLFGSQEPATTFVPPKVLGHVDSAGLPFDPKRAREELSASHWKKPKKTLEIMIINRERNQLLAQFLQQEVRKNLGVDIDIIGFDNKTYRAQLAQSASPIYILSWSADFPDPDNFLSVHL
ncbi:MAG: peptide ABC transporter substrate-binding protein, partial [Bdellovibrio sp.]|nr:peptide ABC transporter substrate-binding protein [Bdellovibrio sp.]